MIVEKWGKEEWGGVRKQVGLNSSRSETWLAISKHLFLRSKWFESAHLWPVSILYIQMTCSCR